MKSVIKKMKKYKYDKKMLQNIWEKDQHGTLDAKNLKILSFCVNLILLTFIVRFFARVYIMYCIANTDLATFIHHQNVSLFVWLLAYCIFANYLLKISNIDKNRSISARYGVKTLLFLLICLLEIFINMFFFVINFINYQALATICLFSLLLTVMAYFGIFITILDFIMSISYNKADK